MRPYQLSLRLGLQVVDFEGSVPHMVDTQIFPPDWLWIPGRLCATSPNVPLMRPPEKRAAAEFFSRAVLNIALRKLFHYENNRLEEIENTSGAGTRSCSPAPHYDANVGPVVECDLGSYWDTRRAIFPRIPPRFARA